MEKKLTGKLVVETMDYIQEMRTMNPLEIVNASLDEYKRLIEEGRDNLALPDRDGKLMEIFNSLDALTCAARVAADFIAKGKPGSEKDDADEWDWEI